MKIKVLIIDQFATLSPYQLQQARYPFERLCVEALRGDFDRPALYTRKAEVKEVDEDFRPEMGTSVFRADADGSAELWKYRWDSSD